MSSSATRSATLPTALFRSLASWPSIACALVLTLVSAYPFIFTSDSHRQFFFDLWVYYGAVEHWQQTGDLYGWALYSDRPYGFTYPPFAAIAFLPLLVFPDPQTAGPFVLLINIFLMVAVTFLSQKALGISARLALAVALWTAPLELMLFPLRENMLMGQTNLVLLLLILLDGLVFSGTRFSGIFSAIAASIKMTPALFIIYFLIKKDWGGVLRFIGTGLAAILLSFCIDFKVSYEFFTDKIFQSDRVGSIVEPLSYNLYGEFARLFPLSLALPLYAVSALVILVLAIFSARKLYLRGEKLMMLTVIGFLPLLVSPISWNHHWVWIVPALVSCLIYGMRKADSGYLFMTVSGLVLFTRLFESWFSDNKWQIGQWPLYAVLMHMLPTLWSVCYLILPLAKKSPLKADISA